MHEPHIGRVDDLLEDLEQQAAGMHLAERDAELADRARGEYAAVTLAGRVHASLGCHVRFTLSGGQGIAGVVSDAGVDWCIVSERDSGTAWLVRLAEVVVARGMSPRSVPERARSVLARRGFGSALHGLVGETGRALVQTSAGEALWVRVMRIGADFVEVDVVDERGRALESGVLVPVGGVRAVRLG